MQKLDGKFHGIIARDLDGAHVPPDQFIVFLAKDNALPATLEVYYQECKRIGAEREQLDAIERLQTRVRNWRAANPDKCKIPDAEPGECH
jgi:hypothetical protein